MTSEAVDDMAEIVPISNSIKPPEHAKKVVGMAAPPSGNPSLPGRESWKRNSTVSGNGISQMQRPPQGRRTVIQNKAEIRNLIAQSSFYHSPVAIRLRLILHGRDWGLLMTLFLFVALFMPDIWVLAGANNNTVIDWILFFVMILFVVEICLLSAVDKTYFLSFFFVMDIIGTITMVFDISFLFGPDNTKVQTYSGDGSNKNNLMLLRATRAARVGARAGRLSRVLRVLRFLPFLKHKHVEEKQGGMAGNISAQLANLLATRVACLTIVLVIVIPLFDLLMFPQSDYSLRTWTERASRIYNDAALDTATKDALLNDAFTKMITFYDVYPYGPYRACAGHQGADGGAFVCETVYTLSSWLNGSPPRAASSWEVQTSDFMIAFNMHAPTQVDAVLAIGTICFIMLIMIFSGLVLSSVVTELAVRPLERMLGTVKHIASTVFKFATEKEETPEEEEAYDIDSSSEMKLLERVVAKLATIAHLQAESTANVDTRDMDESDVGILSMMKGTNLVEEKKKQDRRSMAVTRRNAFTPTVNLEDIGMSQEVYNSWSFNILSLSKPQKINAAMFTIHRFHESGDGFVNTEAEIATLKRFVNKVETEYLAKNPFHNFSHATDVLLAVARWMRVNDSHTFLVELEQFALLIAAISHDLAHPGVNNAFLTEVAHELALEYNDRSPLENMHCAKLYTMVINPTLNPFATLSKDQYKDVRKYCIETILHTDMMGHNGMVKELQLLYEVKSEIFATSEGKNNIAVAEVFNTGETKFLVMNNILHSADVSNPCRTWEVCRPWAMQVLEEFFEQGDQEKRLGVPVQFLNDRDKLNRPNSQIGFLEFMIVPHFAAQIRLWPTMAEMGQNLQTNLQHWEEIWKKESSPSEEEATKTRNRVKKACGTLEEAEHCRKTEKKVAVH